MPWTELGHGEVWRKLHPALPAVWYAVDFSHYLGSVQSMEEINWN